MRKKTSSSESARSASAGGTSSAASEGTLVSRRLPGTIAESVSAIDAKFFFCKQKTAYEFLRSDWSSDVCSSDLFAMVDAMTRAVSPYAYGPFYVNPLERIAAQFHYDKVCSDAGPRFFVGATNVHNGKIRVFTGDDISTDSLLASACLPTLFKAVEIDGEHYWDGGYTGNPALFPLFAPELPEDILIVHINPLVREDVPKSPQEIQNRINEISFNSSLLRELRAIGFVQRLLEDGSLTPGSMKRVHVHMIADDVLMRELSVASKLMPTPYLLHRLRDAGYAAAEGFLEQHRDDLNQRSSVDLAAMYN